jgi:hypothetical protein
MAGVLEDGDWMQMKEGTPQGGSISPLMANIYLHYVFDLWIHAWRRRHASGEVIVVRFADDVIVGFQCKAEAVGFQEELRGRLGEFNLELHPEKTRLMEFGRFAAKNRRQRDEGKPETFNFLGFTHICSRTKNGAFTVRRKTMRKKLRAKLAAIKEELRCRMHENIRKVGPWLRSVLVGHYQYYAVPRNSAALGTFRYRIIQMWKQSLGRRSQNGKVNWKRMGRYIERWTPYPQILHPYPSQRLRVTTQGRSPVR